MFKRMKLRTRLLIIGCVLTAVPLIITIISTISAFKETTEVSRKESLKLAYADLDHIAMGVYNMVETQQNALEKFIRNSLSVAKDKIKSKGGISFIDEIVTWNAVNQYTKNFTRIDLPKMTVGNKWLGQIRDPRKKVPIVDAIHEMLDVQCSIFQRMNPAGDMIRIATSVIGTDGLRALGTYVPVVNPDGKPNTVLSKVLRGQIHTGRAFAVNKWYITAYEPLYDMNHNIIGMIATGIPQDATHVLKQHIMDIKVGATGYVWVLDPDGKYIISKGGLRDGEDISQAKDPDGKYFVQEMIKKAMALKGKDITEHYYPWKNPGDPAPRYKIARIMYFKPWKWVIGVGSYEDEFFSSANNIENTAKKNMRFDVIVFIVALLVALLVWFFTSKGITGPIVEIAQVIRRIAKDRDLTRQVPVRTQDEIGDMAAGFNEMTQELIRAFRFVSDSAKSVDVQADEVANRARSNKERAAAEEKRALEIQKTVQEMGATAGNVNQAAMAQKDAAISSNKSIEELIANMNTAADASRKQLEEADVATERVIAMGETGAKVVATAEEQSIQVEDVTRSMNEISIAVEEMTKAAHRSTEHGRRVLEAARAGAESVNATVEGMRAIAESSDQISEIISVITEIAEQTNLLALNAAIEAARAGAHGKGFAVVADEVGKLAQRSSEAAKEITQLIKDSTARVAEGTQLTDQSQEALNKIAEGGQVNMRAIEEISKTVDMLAEGSRAVSAKMEDLNELARTIRGMAGQQGARREAAQNALNELVEQSGAIAKLVESANNAAIAVGKEMEVIVERSEKMEGFTLRQAERSKKLIQTSTESADAARKTLVGAGEVVNITEELRELAGTLTEQVERFKIEENA